MAVALLGDAAAAEDVVQDIFVAVYLSCSRVLGGRLPLLAARSAGHPVEIRT